MSKDNVVYLSFQGAAVDAARHTVMRCRGCLNQTFRLCSDDDKVFPTLICAGCGDKLGKMGWAE